MTTNLIAGHLMMIGQELQRLVARLLRKQEVCRSSFVPLCLNGQKKNKKKRKKDNII